ncbi:MAG: hypothetical protein J6R22_00630 [Alphaproteobacteria bacterium]|nr:hypothetical protein [Alphaproteobacteria bacterium]
MKSSDLKSWLNSGAHIIYATTGRPSKHVSTLAEVFLEYYLFDADTPKTIEDFLTTEELNDVFTADQIMNLMCGRACLHNDLVSLIHTKLPFEISLGRLYKLNANAFLMGAAEISPAEMVNLSKKETEEKQKKKRETKAEYNRRYREKHADKIKQQQKEYYQANREQRLARARARYAENPETFSARLHTYYVTHTEKCLARDRKYRQENHEHILRRNRAYRIAHPDSNKENYQRIKARKELAKTMCPVFMYICELRATNLEKYLTKYKKVQDIAGQAIRAGCVALGNQDITQCPIVMGGVSKRTQCQMQLAFEFRGAVGRVAQIAQEIKANQKH